MVSIWQVERRRAEEIVRNYEEKKWSETERRGW